MNEENIRKKLEPAYKQTHTDDIPDFDKVWANAEAAYGDSRRQTRVVRGIAAVLAVAVIAATLWPSQQAEFSDDYLIADALMNSTSWSAPSDSTT